jgi:pimeloyl-ACP methyl ester carboxylesterase
MSSDPLGYPDGWNNLAYCNNSVTVAFDWLGGTQVIVIGGADETTSHHALERALNRDEMFGKGNYILFTWDAGEAIINHINSLPEGEDVVIIGHSYGGATAWDIADDVNKPVSGLITLDPVGWFTNFWGEKPDGVDSWINVYADQEGYSFNDWIADMGGQWGTEDLADINIIGNIDHNDPYGMLILKLPNSDKRLIDVIKELAE